MVNPIHLTKKRCGLGQIEPLDRRVTRRIQRNQGKQSSKGHVNEACPRNERRE